MLGSPRSLSLSLCAVLAYSVSGHVGAGAAQVALGVEIGREGQVLMRQGLPPHKEGEAPKKSSLAEAGPRRHRVPDEAAEAFTGSTKIDDSWGSPRMPAFIEKYPQFYSALFVGGALAFLGLVCFYVYYEDQQQESKRRRMAYAVARRRLASADAVTPSLAPRGAPYATQNAQPSPAALRAAVEAAAAAVRAEQAQEERRDISTLTPAPKARAGRAMAATAENGMHAITAAMGNITGILAGGKPPKLESSRASTADTTASGASTPLSSPPSVVGGSAASAISGSSRPKYETIRSGTVLRAKVTEVIFASTTSWQEIGELTAGQQVTAAGPPEMADDYTMVPIKPRGAVDMKVLEVIWDY